MVSATWQDHGTWQALTIEKDGAGKAIQSGDAIYLRAHTQNVVTVEGTRLHAKGNNKDARERLVIEKKGTGGPIYPNDTVYLRAHTGKFISVDGINVVAEGDNKEAREAFVLEKGDAAR